MDYLSFNQVCHEVGPEEAIRLLFAPLGVPRETARQRLFSGAYQNDDPVVKNYQEKSNFLSSFIEQFGAKSEADFILKFNKKSVVNESDIMQKVIAQEIEDLLHLMQKYTPVATIINRYKAAPQTRYDLTHKAIALALGIPKAQELNPRALAQAIKDKVLSRKNLD